MYVYFIQCDNKDRYTKIGMADNPDRRLEEMQTGCPYPLRLLASMQCESRKHAFNMENKLHRIFKDRHVRGEWFKPINLRHAQDVMDQVVERKDSRPCSKKEWEELELLNNAPEL